jgi:TolA-binding protein
MSLMLASGADVASATSVTNPSILTRPPQRAPITAPVDPGLERQAKHDLDTARFYFSKRKAYAGAKDRLMDIAAAYPEFTQIDEVYFLLAECFAKTNDAKSARHFFELLLEARPESEFAERAKKRLSELPPTPPEEPGPEIGDTPGNP